MKKTIYTPEAIRLTTWLKKQREAKGLTMREVGKIIGKPHSYVGKVETGERRLDVIELIWYCRLLRLDPHEALSVIENQQG